MIYFKLINIFLLSHSCITQESLTKLESLVLNLRQTGSMQTAMVLASWLIQK